MIYPTFAKRALDVAASTIALLAASPLCAGIAIALWLTEGRPLFFVQERTGRHRETFRLLKFRTMRTGSDDEARGSEADRISPIGALLRKTSLDELPELMNVLRGEMSLVGPRPLPVRYTNYFRPRELARFDVRPGITGLAQVSGRNELGWTQRFALDVEYAQSVSLRTDLRILWRTLNVTAHGDGLVVDPGGAMRDLDVERADDVDEQAADGS